MHEGDRAGSGRGRGGRDDRGATGVYRDELLFSADVTLVAEDGPGTVVIDTSGRAGIVVTAGTVQLRDVEIRGGTRRCRRSR